MAHEPKWAREDIQFGLPESYLRPEAFNTRYAIPFPILNFIVTADVTDGSKSVIQPMTTKSKTRNSRDLRSGAKDLSQTL